jgi:hypothetical protein
MDTNSPLGNRLPGIPKAGGQILEFLNKDDIVGPGQLGNNLLHNLESLGTFVLNVPYALMKPRSAIQFNFLPLCRRLFAFPWLLTRSPLLNINQGFNQ